MIIKCKECKADISDTAKICPKCGAEQFNLIRVLISVAIVIGVGYFIWSCGNNLIVGLQQIQQEFENGILTSW